MNPFAPGVLQDFAVHRSAAGGPCPGAAADAIAGLFGKLPARGDFVPENLPRDFIDGWDGWWRQGLAETQARWRDEWDDAWLESAGLALHAAAGALRQERRGAVAAERRQGRTLFAIDDRRCGAV